MGRHDDALTGSDRLAALDLQEAWPHFGRALVAFAQGRTVDGNGHLERASPPDPDSPHQEG